MLCADCGPQRRPGRGLRGVLGVELASLPDRWPPASSASREFLLAFLPLDRAETLPHLAVGDTPLLAAPVLAARLGMKETAGTRLWIKDDTRNPSGSTKDRASLLVCAKAREFGYGTVVTASTGNAASALATCAAATGLRAVVMVPATAPLPKLAQMRALGARVLPVAADYDACFELSITAGSRFGWYNRNTAFNPYSIEGKKTLALEIIRQMRPEIPDVLVVPVGDGVILAGVAKGLRDLVAAGLLARMPRLIAVQAERSDAVARAFAAGREAVDDEDAGGATSVADSLNVRYPRNDRLCLHEIRASGGTVLRVADARILAAVRLLGETTGIFAEPAGAAALAGLDQAFAAGHVARDERTVLLVTGHGLKDPTAALPAQPLRPVTADIEAIAAAVADMA
jgi:threonine synthase